MHKLTSASAAGLALLTVSINSHAQTYVYRLTEITKDFPLAINDSGNVTGHGPPCPECRGHKAFLWIGKQPLTYISGVLPEELKIRDSFGTDINNEGLITVNAFGSNSSTYAFIWNGLSSIQPIPSLPHGTDNPQTEARAINSSGHVTGHSWTRAVVGGLRRQHAFVWDGATSRDLGIGQGTDINDAGWVTGQSADTVAPGFNRAFLWDGTTLKDIGTLGGEHSEGTSINAKGQITGWAQTANNDTHHAFLWDRGLMMDLGTLYGSDVSSGRAINDSGQVVGNSFSTDFIAPLRGFLWEKGRMRNLNGLIAANDPLKASIRTLSAIDINNLGQIVVAGRNAAIPEPPRRRAYLMSPRYQVTGFLSPASSSVQRATKLRIAIGLLDEANVRIPDSRAVLLATDPCRVLVVVTGAQTLQKTCMTYDAAANQFFFDWQLGSVGTGAATIEVRVKYGAPGPLTTTKTKAITITS